MERSDIHHPVQAASPGGLGFPSQAPNAAPGDAGNCLRRLPAYVNLRPGAPMAALLVANLLHV